MGGRLFQKFGWVFWAKKTLWIDSNYRLTCGVKVGKHARYSRLIGIILRVGPGREQGLGVVERVCDQVRVKSKFIYILTLQNMSLLPLNWYKQGSIRGCSTIYRKEKGIEKLDQKSPGKFKVERGRLWRVGAWRYRVDDKSYRLKGRGRDRDYGEKRLSKGSRDKGKRGEREGGTMQCRFEWAASRKELIDRIRSKE